MLPIISNKFVLVNKLESDYLNDKNGKKIIKHSFLSDMFVNTLLFQIEILINDVVNLKVAYSWKYGWWHFKQLKFWFLANKAVK